MTPKIPKIYKKGITITWNLDINLPNVTIKTPNNIIVMYDRPLSIEKKKV